jgi:hypothetical protein
MMKVKFGIAAKRKKALAKRINTYAELIRALIEVSKAIERLNEKE